MALLRAEEVLGSLERGALVISRPTRYLVPMRIVITGANRGIGLELVRQCLARGDSVIATARNPQDARELQSLAGGSRELTVLCAGRMSWRDHVVGLVATGHVSRAAITGLDGNPWGATPGFVVSPTEAK